LVAREVTKPYVRALGVRTTPPRRPVVVLVPQLWRSIEFCQDRRHVQTRVDQLEMPHRTLRAPTNPPAATTPLAAVASAPRYTVVVDARLNRRGDSASTVCVA